MICLMGKFSLLNFGFIRRSIEQMIKQLCNVFIAYGNRRFVALRGWDTRGSSYDHNQSSKLILHCFLKEESEVHQITHVISSKKTVTLGLANVVDGQGPAPMCNSTACTIFDWNPSKKDDFLNFKMYLLHFWAIVPKLSGHVLDGDWSQSSRTISEQYSLYQYYFPKFAEISRNLSFIMFIADGRF